MAAKDEKRNPTKVIENPFFSKSCESLYLNSKYADIHFTFKSSDERVPAHKIVLSANNPVFEAAFFGPLAENDEIKINDEGIDADAFKVFLQFFYLKKMELSMEHIQSVMHLCHKYQMDECFDNCLSFLEENLTNDDLCMCYQLAINYEHNEFKRFCELKISMNAYKMLQSEEFLNCDWSMLNAIMRMDKLNCNESDLLEACINWARYHCERKQLNADDEENIRNELKGVIYQIRFNQFTLADFIDHLQKNPRNFYNRYEMDDIICVMGKRSVTSPEFNLSSRLVCLDSIPWDDSKKLNCTLYRNTVNEYEIPKVVSTIFSSDKLLILGGLSLHVGYCCTISVERMDLEEKIFDNFKKPAGGFSALLPSPIIVLKNIKYKIQLDFSTTIIIGQVESHGIMKPEVKLSNGATITFHQDESSDFDNVTKGTTHRLYFNEI